MLHSFSFPEPTLQTFWHFLNEVVLWITFFLIWIFLSLFLIFRTYQLSFWTLVTSIWAHLLFSIDFDAPPPSSSSNFQSISIWSLLSISINLISSQTKSIWSLEPLPQVAGPLYYYFSSLAVHSSLLSSYLSACSFHSILFTIFGSFLGVHAFISHITDSAGRGYLEFIYCYLSFFLELRFSVRILKEALEYFLRGRLRNDHPGSSLLSSLFIAKMITLA